MKTKTGRPWFAFLIDRLVGKTGPNTIYTVGKTIYTSSIASIGQDIMLHESQHARQQAAAAPILGVLVWWVRYLLSTQYRLNQELDAYRHQYRWMRPSDKNAAARYAVALAGVLAGPLYGRVIDFQAARQAILRPEAAPSALRA